ncbi:MAG TPA: hypothetical protein VHE30_06665 [Polyangiaceae bacterium]|nr:hypothetical protein [Polyangiaceae bacterium]
MKRSKTSAKPSLQRRDGAGHLNPEYAAELLSRGREGRDSDAQPFVDGVHAPDSVAEELAEEFVETVTNAQNEGQDVLDSKAQEEDGGPFVITKAETEFAEGTDESNIEGALREPFPTT